MKHALPLFWFLVGLNALAACGVVDRNVEPQRTITQGIYGQTTTAGDQLAPTENYDHDIALAIYDVDPFVSEATAITTRRTDAQGFYEADLAPGDYWICRTFGPGGRPSCCTFSVTEGSTVRRDYEFGDGRGWNAGAVTPNHGAR
jgi:hypothetical protein